MSPAFKIAYDGRMFKGLARQPDQPTVEGVIIKALEAMRAIKDPEEAMFRSGSRTDRGVSSLGNVIFLRSPMKAETIIRAMNGSFHQDGVWFLGWAQVPDDFRPRHAVDRWYRYMVPWYSALSGPPSGPGAGRDLPLRTSPNVGAMKDAAGLFLGEHDFSSFRKVDKSDPERSSVRTIDAIDIVPLTLTLGSELVGNVGETMALKEGSAPVPFDDRSVMGLVMVDIRGQSFLWQMVRRMVSALVRVGTGQATKDDISRALSGQGPDLGILPPEYLTLMDVSYDLEFHEPKGHHHLVDGIKDMLSWSLTTDLLFYHQLREVVSRDGTDLGHRR